MAGRETGPRGGETNISISIPRESLPEAMNKTMALLKEVNGKFGGILFVSVGEGDREALIFPTPTVLVAKDNLVKEQMLVLTTDGFKIIQEDHDPTLSQGYIKDISEWVARRMGRNPARLSADGRGYRADLLEIKCGEQLAVTSKGAGSYRETGSYRGHRVINDKCVLVGADPDSVKRILELNLERVRTVQAGAKAAQEVLTG